MRLIILLLSLFSNQVFAVLAFEDAVSPEFVTSARALGMGNAYMGKVDDGWAAFYNPAGLGTVRGFRFHLANLHLETNNGFLDITSKGEFYKSFTKYADAFKPLGLQNLHEDSPGKTSHARIQLFPNMTFRGMTLGYMYVKQTRARLMEAGADFEIAERVDSGPVFALSLSFFGGIWKIGGAVTYLTRKEVQKDFSTGQPVTLDEEVDYKRATMTHITAGTRLTLPIAALPTFSVVLRNSSQNDFYASDLGGAPERIPQTLDYSFSLTPNLGRTFRMHWEIARKDVMDKYALVPEKRKLMTGIEFDYMRKMFVRFGLGDGWGSVGVGVRNKSFSFDLTSYAIEGSQDGYREQEDRRHIISLSGGF